MTVRPFRIEDAERVGELMVPLGYPQVDAETVFARVERLVQGAPFNVFVAELAGLVVGWVHVAWYVNLITGGYAEVCALVVDEGCQRRGVGKKLIAAAEAWAVEATQADRIRLGSGVHRTEAHKFYESMGYTTQRASYVFQKPLQTVTERS
ncbi:MAG: GNAT family N-acetyltransferase [Burkholderiales bacterium]|nr:GNAT family N-acetyltransferase [Burkholderiales bacterium]